MCQKLVNDVREIVVMPREIDAVPACGRRPHCREVLQNILQLSRAET